MKKIITAIILCVLLISVQPASAGYVENCFKNMYGEDLTPADFGMTKWDSTNRVYHIPAITNIHVDLYGETMRIITWHDDRFGGTFVQTVYSVYHGGGVGLVFIPDEV